MILDKSTAFICISKKEKEIFVKSYLRELNKSLWPFKKKTYEYIKTWPVNQIIPFLDIDYDFSDYESNWLFKILLTDTDISDEEKSVISDLKDKFYKRLNFYKKTSLIIPTKPINNKSSKLICDIIESVEIALGPMTELGKPREYYKRVAPTKDHCELLIEYINAKLRCDSPMPMFSFRKEVFRVLKNIYKMNETDETDKTDEMEEE